MAVTERSNKKKASKRTKRFQSKHLKGELERRKKTNKIKQRKKPSTTESSESKENTRIETEDQVFKQEKKNKPKNIADVTADEFLEETFFEEDSSDGDENEGVNDSEEDEEDDKDIEADLEEEIAQHKKELEELKKTDPSFAKYLEQEDKQLLEFGSTEQDIDLENEGAFKGLNEITEKATKKMKKAHSITSAMVNKWKKDLLEKKSVKALKKIILAYKVCCFLTDQEDEDEEKTKAKFQIAGSSVFNNVMTFCLKQLPSSFADLLDLSLLSKKKNKQVTATNIKESSNWPKLMRSVKYVVKDTIHFLSTVTDENTIAFALKSCEKFIPFIATLPNQAKSFLKSLFKLWGTGHETNRIVAFMNIRELCIQLPELLPICLKGVYLTYVRNSKFVSMHSLQVINFMANCVVEVYGLDFSWSYQHAFVYIRQLAIHLRNALHLKTKESNQNIYNWQFVNSLKVWTLVLTTHLNEELRPLIYPLVQIITGVIKLIPTSRYFPLRFHCTKMLNIIGAATGTFINVAPYIIETLDTPELKKRKLKPSKALDFAILVKISKSGLQTKAFQDTTIHYVQSQLLEYYSIHSKSPSFPELIVATIVHLKSFARNAVVTAFKKKIQQIIEQLEKNAQFVNSHRQSLEFNPQKIDDMVNFLKDSKTPLETYYAQFKANEKKQLELLRSKADEMNENGDNEEVELSEEEGDEEEDIDITTTHKRKKQNKSDPKTKENGTKKQKQKQIPKMEEDGGDTVQDLVISDEDE